MSRLLASLFLFAMPIAAQAPPDVVEYDFVSGGAVRLKLAAGEYTVRAGALPDRIRIRWSTREPEDRAKVRISSEIRGTEARVETRGPKNFRVEIEVPARTDLHVRLSAGELKVLGIEGNKNIESRAGDVEIDVVQPDHYRRVDASVTFGGVEARPFAASKGGSGRSFKWKGPGSYDLHAHLFVGDLTLK